MIYNLISATQRNTTLHTPPPCNAPWPTHPSHPFPTQLGTSSRKDAFEVRGGCRDRGGLRLRDRGPGRPRSSRSWSPKDASKPRFRRPSSEQETNSLSACPICLSRKRHPIRKCQATSLWNGQRKSRCTRTEDGRIVDVDGRTLCSNWNQTIGCKDQRSNHVHECLGCRESTHRAQNCSLAEKTQTPDPAGR